MGRIAKNYLYTLAYQVLVLIAPIITAPYLARVLGATKLGIYSYIYSSGSIITTVALLGIYSYGNRQTAYVRDDKRLLSATYWELQMAHIVLGLLGSLIYVVYATINSEYIHFFWLYYPYIFAQFIDCSWLYVGLEDMRPAVAKNFICKVVTVIGIFVLVKTKDDLWKYILLISTTTFVTTISIYSQVPKHIDNTKGKISNIPKHIRGSIQLFLPQVASLFYLQVDKVMLKWLTGVTNQVSFYDQAEKIIYIPLSLITVLSTVMMPRIANEYQKGDNEVIQKLLVKAGRFALILAFPMMVGLACISIQFVPWYLGNEFILTSYAIIILSPIIVLNSLSGISGSQFFTATNQINVLLKSYVTAAIVNIIVNILLIPKHGYSGAAIATVLASLLSMVFQYAVLLKQVDLSELLKPGAKYFFSSLIMGGIIVLTTWKLPSTPFTTIIQLLMGVLTYGVMTVCLLHDEMIQELFSELKTKLIKNK